MTFQRRFLFALAISFALHLLVISGPGWHLPSLADLLNSDDAPMLDAHLVDAPRVVPKKPGHPKARKHRQPSVASAEAPPPESVDGSKVSDGGTPPPVEDSVGTAEDSPASTVVAPIDIALPKVARIWYRVIYGANGFIVGAAFQELRQDGSVYSVRSSAETTGIVSLFKPASIVNISEGEIVDGGFRPREFRVERSGRAEVARFDWESGRGTLPNGRQIELRPGTQDMLSMFCQLALMPTNVAVISIPVVTSKVVERYDFTVLGEEKIMTPRGERMTLHLRNTQANGTENTEVWLGLDDAHLPIRIQHTDRKGDTFEQIAERIEFEETKEGTR
jgi:hypothetical protein